MQMMWRRKYLKQSHETAWLTDFHPIFSFFSLTSQSHDSHVTIEMKKRPRKMASYLVLNNDFSPHLLILLSSHAGV